MSLQIVHITLRVTDVIINSYVRTIDRNECALGKQGCMVTLLRCTNKGRIAKNVNKYANKYTKNSSLYNHSIVIDTQLS